MKKHILHSLFLLMIFNTFAQGKYTITVFINREKQIIDNNFKMYFVHISDNGKIVYVPEISKDTIIIPYEIFKLEMDFYWLLKYKHHNYLIEHSPLYGSPEYWMFYFSFFSSSTYKSTDGYWYSDCCGWLSKKDSLKGCYHTEYSHCNHTLIFNMKKYKKLSRLLLRNLSKNDAKQNERIVRLEKEYQQSMYLEN